MHYSVVNKFTIQILKKLSANGYRNDAVDS